MSEVTKRFITAAVAPLADNAELRHAARQQLGNLPPDERLELARQLLVSVDLEPEPGAAAAWEKEIMRRLASFKSGEVKSIPAEEVFSRLRQIAPNP